MPNHRPDAIDALIERQLNAHGNGYFHINEMAARVRALLARSVNFPFSQSVDWPTVIEKEVIYQRIAEVLRSKKDSHGNRVWECYPTGLSGGYRWQRFTGMHIDDLRAMINARKRRIAGEQSVIDAYERILTRMERVGAQTVGEVYKAA